MSEERTSSTETVTIYVRLLNEGTDVLRPVAARRISDTEFLLLQPEDYDPFDEQWEFPPGSVVHSRPEIRRGEQVLVATS
jgi:hypothetical protein